MKVSGKISDSKGALSGAEVILLRDNERTNLGGITNQDGEFKIENEGIEEGDVFEIRYLGYKTQFIKANNLQDAEIKMIESADELDEVIITTDLGKKPKTEKSTTKAWYENPALLLGGLALVTTGVIIYIIKKSK